MRWHCLQYPCSYTLSSWGAASEGGWDAEGEGGPTGSIPKPNPCSLADPCFTSPGFVWMEIPLSYLTAHAGNTLDAKKSTACESLQMKLRTLLERLHVCKHRLTTASLEHLGSPWSSLEDVGLLQVSKPGVTQILTPVPSFIPS